MAKDEGEGGTSKPGKKASEGDDVRYKKRLYCQNEACEHWVGAKHAANKSGKNIYDNGIYLWVSKNNYKDKRCNKCESKDQLVFKKGRQGQGTEDWQAPRESAKGRTK